MAEHAFMATMLAIVSLEGLVAIVVASYLGYQMYRKSERIEGVTAAIYLEARKILGQIR